MSQDRLKVARYLIDEFFKKTPKYNLVPLWRLNRKYEQDEVGKQFGISFRIDKMFNSSLAGSLHYVIGDTLALKPLEFLHGLIVSFKKLGELVSAIHLGPLRLGVVQVLNRSELRPVAVRMMEKR